MKKSTPKKATSWKSKNQTDWKRIDAMKDEDIDFSDSPEATTEMFARGGVPIHIYRGDIKVHPDDGRLV